MDGAGAKSWISDAASKTLRDSQDAGHPQVPSPTAGVPSPRELLAVLPARHSALTMPAPGPPAATQRLARHRR